MLRCQPGSQQALQCSRRHDVARAQRSDTAPLVDAGSNPVGYLVSIEEAEESQPGGARTLSPGGMGVGARAGGSPVPPDGPRLSRVRQSERTDLYAPPGLVLEEPKGSRILGGMGQALPRNSDAA